MRLGDTVEDGSGGHRLLRAGALHQCGDGHRLKDAEAEFRKPAPRRLFGRHRRHRQVAGSADDDGHDLRIRLQCYAGDRAKQPEGLHVGFGRGRKIDGETAPAAQMAHQATADEHMLRVEGDGAGELAPRFEPHRSGRIVIEDMQGLLGQQRQHQRRVELRLVRDCVDDRRFGVPGHADPRVVHPPGKL